MLHDNLVTVLWPGEDPITPYEYRDTHLLASAVGRPFQSAFGKDVYPGILRKAAALFHSLIASHPFHNGNKRTAVLALDHFLLANGYFLALSDTEMYDLARSTATYRKQGLTHETIFSEIHAALKNGTIPFQKEKIRELSAAFYANCRRLRKLIRKHELNRQKYSQVI